MARPKNKFREEAKRLGVTRYFDPRPCLKGHIAERLTSCGVCVICNNEKTKHQYHNNPKANATIKDAGRRRHTKVGTKWYHENKQRAADLNKKWREEHKDSFNEYCILWRRENLHKLCKNAAAYRAQKIQATPIWANHDEIEIIYECAQRLTTNTKITHTVDHVIPLTSKLVCGLHVENNLQILTLSKNSSKNNKIII